MQDRRLEPRMLCADLVDVEWGENGNGRHHAVANLEDISLSGACLQTDVPIPRDAPVRITYPGGTLRGMVRYCIFRQIGYFVGIRFLAGCRWSKRSFRPLHLLDPRSLVARRLASCLRSDPPRQRP